MPIDIQAILKDLETKIINLAKSSFKDATKQATADGKELWEELKEDVTRWVRLLADGKITAGEFEVLAIGKEDLIKMTALTQAGLALARIDKFKGAVIDLIIDTVTGIIP
jgi:hypothetical protein